MRLAFPRRVLSTLALGAVLALTAACGGSDGSSNSSGGSSGSADAVTELTITPVGNQLEYEQTEFTVPAGEEITLTFKNTATAAAMKHNVVILTTSDDAVVQKVGQAGSSVPGKDYIPDSDAVLAATPLSDPGETVEVTFTAPSETGTYTYLCTYPGHYVAMQGTMRVVES
jgi:azurin